MSNEKVNEIVKAVMKRQGLENETKEEKRARLKAMLHTSSQVSCPFAKVCDCYNDSECNGDKPKSCDKAWPILKGEMEKFEEKGDET